MHINLCLLSETQDLVLIVSIHPDYKIFDTQKALVMNDETQQLYGTHLHDKHD